MRCDSPAVVKLPEFSLQLHGFKLYICNVDVNMTLRIKKRSHYD